jgi:hypothetical protein
VERGQPEVILRRYTGPSDESALSMYVAQGGGWDATSSPGFLVGGSSWKPGPGTLAVTYRRDDRPSA